MAVVFNGVKQPQSQLEEIQSEIYLTSDTIGKNLVSIDEGHKSGTDSYESKVSIVISDANRGPVTATGNINAVADKTVVNLTTFNIEDVIDESTLLNTRFEKSMKAGAFNIVSDEFARKVLIDVAPAIGEAVDSMIWNGATTATKAAVAASALSAANKAIVAAMPTTKIDSLGLKVLYNDSVSKVVPGVGASDCIQVATPAVITAATIAAEYQRVFNGAPNKVTLDRRNPAVFFAPYSHRAMIMEANNSATNFNKQFLIEGIGESETISFQGAKIEFVGLDKILIFCDRRFLKVLMDLKSDVTGLIIEPEANASQRLIMKNIQTMATHVTNQRYITIHVK